MIWYQKEQRRFLLKAALLSKMKNPAGHWRSGIFETVSLCYSFTNLPVAV